MRLALTVGNVVDNVVDHGSGRVDQVHVRVRVEITDLGGGPGGP